MSTFVGTYLCALVDLFKTLLAGLKIRIAQRLKKPLIFSRYLVYFVSRLFSVKIRNL